MRQANKFCGCIKAVRRSVTLRKGSGKGMSPARARESAAIAICTKSVLQTKGRTLRSVKCGKKGQRAKLQTQRLRR
jgi:hypothetical protein